MRKRGLVWLILLVGIAATLGWYLFAERTVPAGQPPLATLDVGSLAALRADFNRDADKVRIVVLLSPT